MAEQRPAPPKSRPRCPECKKAVPDDLPAAAPCRPFCCDRCKMVDLSKWLGGSYAIAGEAALPDDDEH